MTENKPILMSENKGCPAFLEGRCRILLNWLQRIGRPNPEEEIIRIKERLMLNLSQADFLCPVMRGRVFKEIVFPFIRKATMPGYEFDVLIRGETGTGKELIACTIYHNSATYGKPFITVNSAEIVESLEVSETQGIEKRRATGVDKFQGLFLTANDGIFFLDEIADIRTGLQVKLARVLQEGEIRPVGSSKTIKVRFRLITATHRNLEELIKQGQIDAPFFYRINKLPIHLTPLRERTDDIPELVDFFLLCLMPDKKIKVNEKTLKVLQAYDWPGNVRELQNVIGGAVLSLRAGAYSNISNAIVEEIKSSGVMLLQRAKRIGTQYYGEIVKTVISHIQTHGAITSRELKARFNISKTTAVKIFEKMKGEELIRAMGDGRATRYVLNVEKISSI